MANKKIKITKVRENAKLPESNNGNWYDCYISGISIVRLDDHKFNMFIGSPLLYDMAQWPPLRLLVRRLLQAMRPYPRRLCAFCPASARISFPARLWSIAALVCAPR